MLNVNEREPALGAGGAGFTADRHAGASPPNDSRAIDSSRATRSAIGGWVENRLRTPPAAVRLHRVDLRHR